MYATTSADAAKPVLIGESCCNKPRDPFVIRMETIAIALGIIAAIAAPVPFVISVGLGAAYQFTKTYFNYSAPEQGTSRPGCGQGYGEFFSGVKFWPPEVVGVIAALAWEHLMMDPYFYVPFFGFFIGMRAAYYSSDFFPCLKPKPTCCQCTA